MVAVQFIAGLFVLVYGAEILVRGASCLARRLGMSALVVGLTVVAFGTSAPELAVNVQAALKGTSDIAIGNVVGSNTFNLLVIAGAAALAAPLLVQRRLVKVDAPIMLGVSVLAWGMAWNGAVGRGEALVLVALLGGYMALQVWLGRREGAGESDEPAPKPGAKAAAWDALLVVGGLVFLVLGARWLVASAVSIAQSLGVSELVIGLTVVAGGTSLPELATSVVATIRGQRDIAVGNIVGSSIFNILAVLGVATVISGESAVAAPALALDIPVMVLAALVCVPAFHSGTVVSRWEGALLLACYGAYLGVLVADAVGMPGSDLARRALVWGLLPLLALVFGADAWRQRHQHREGAPAPP